MVDEKIMPVSNPSIVLREELDDWALLYDPDSGKAFGINPVGVFIWKRLDGKHSIKDLVEDVTANCTDVPVNVDEHVHKFVDTLIQKGLAGSVAS